MSGNSNINTENEAEVFRPTPTVVTAKSTAASNAVAAKLKAAVAEATSKAPASRGRSTAPKTSTAASAKASSKLTELEAANTAASALRSAARSKSRGRSKSAAPKKEKTSAEKALNKAKRNAETKRKLAPLSKNLGRNATLKNQEHLELLVKLGETREAAIAKILKLNGLSTTRKKRSESLQARINEAKKKLKKNLERKYVGTNMAETYVKLKNEGVNSANILNQLRAIPERDKSSTEKARDALKETIQKELEAVTPEGKEVNSAHLAQLLRLRLSGFKLTGAQYVKLKDALKNIEALEAKAANASLPKSERSAAAKAVKEGTAIAENLVAQKERLDVCAQCELMKAFNL
jgi:hypothetical protein